MSAALFVLANLFTLATAWMLADLLFPKKGQWFYFLSALVLYAVEVVLIELMTGLIGCLTAFAVTLVAGIIYILTVIFRQSRRPEQFKSLLSRRRCLMAAALLVAGCLLGQLAGRYGFKGTHFCADDLTYHAPAAVYWYQAKDISASTLDYHAYKPLNAELFALWFLLPFGQDGLVFLSGLFWIILLCAAAGVLMQNMGIERKWFGPVFFAVFCTDIIVYQATLTFTAVDLAGPTMVLCALAFLVSAASSEQKQPWLYILGAGLCAGFAAGTKVPFTTVCVVLSLWVFIAFKERFAVRAGNLFIFAAAAALMGSYWYIRNIVLTGNPIFPGQFGPWGGALLREHQIQTTILGVLAKSGYDKAMIAEILRQHLNWPKGVLLLAVAGYASGFGMMFLRGPHRKTVGLLLLTACVMLMTYPNMPFSGTNIGVNSPVEVVLRFVIGPFAIGMILFSAGLNMKNKGRWLMYGLYCFGVAAAFWTIPNAIKILAGIVGVLWLIWFQFYGKPVPPVLSAQFLWLSVIAGGLLGLAMAFPFQQARTDRRLSTSEQIGINLEDCWRKVNALPSGSKVVVAGTGGFTYYHYFGRHYQLHPGFLQPGYRPFEPPHKQWLRDPVGTVWSDSKPILADSREWMNLVTQSEADYVVIQKKPQASWSGLYQVLLGCGFARCMDQQDCWSLWEIKK